MLGFCVQEWYGSVGGRYEAARADVQQAISESLEERYLTTGGRWELQKFLMDMAKSDSAKSTERVVDNLAVRLAGTM